MTRSVHTRPRHVLAPERVRFPYAPRGWRESRGAGRELEELDLQALDAAQRSHLIAHEAPALRVRLVGLHVGDHERAHDPVDRSALE